MRYLGQYGVNVLWMTDCDAFAPPWRPGSGTADQNRNDGAIGALAMVCAEVTGISEDLIKRRARQTVVALDLRDHDGGALQDNQIDAAKFVR